MLYLARRWLGYGPVEWDALPWYWQQMFMEGMAAEVAADREAVGGGSAPADVAPGVRQHTERVDFATMPSSALRQWLDDASPH